MKPLWRPLIDGLIEAVVVVDALNLRIVEVNREFLRLTGKTRESLVGRPVVELSVTPEDQFFWEDAAAGLTDEIYSESLLQRADGSLAQVDRRVSKVRYCGNEPAFLIGIRDQSDQRRIEDELEKLIAELRATLESTADGILVLDLEYSIRGYNNRFAELWQLPDALLTQRNDDAIFDWMKQAVIDRSGYLDRDAEIRRAPLLETSDVVVLRSGRILERVTMPQYARGRPIGRVYSFRDITARLADEARLKLASQVFESSLDAILILDPERGVQAANPSASRLTGQTADELTGRRVSDLLFSPDRPEAGEQTVLEVNTHGFWEGEAWYRKADGGSAPATVSIVRVAAGEAATQWIVFIKDLSEHFAARKRIEELAYSDPLTGLPNRVLFLERLQYALSIAGREHRPLAVLFIDLDRFKQINNSLGHGFGDRVLVEVSTRLKGCLRQADTAARLGGDEFVLLLHDADARGAEITARRILDSLVEPVVLDAMRFTVSCSIGIALFPDDGEGSDDLIKNADAAMYRAKERGRSGFRFYKRQMNIDLLARVKIENAMRAGLGAGHFHLHYQPQVALDSGRIVGVEALARWRDPELGDVSPVRFIPVAEETGFIVQLGDWVLRQSVAQCRRWRDEGIELVVAINVSALQFQSRDFVDNVRRALEREQLPPSLLELELTESILVRDADEALARLHALAALGVTVSIDDFGTGYSSLTYLKRFPLQKLKIDRSFIQGLPTDESDVAIARAIIQLGKALKLATIAEGVETPEQHAFLLHEECAEFQGFLCSAALPADQLATIYRAGDGHWRLAANR